MEPFSKREKAFVSEVFGGAKGVSDACLFLPFCPCGASPLHTTPHLELKLPTKLHSLKGSFRHLAFARERKERARLNQCVQVCSAHRSEQIETNPDTPRQSERERDRARQIGLDRDRSSSYLYRLVRLNLSLLYTVHDPRRSGRHEVS